MAKDAEIARLTRDLAAARDCGQAEVCATPPGCARHWEERNRELAKRVSQLDFLLASSQEDHEVTRESCTAQIERLTAERDAQRAERIRLDSYLAIQWNAEDRREGESAEEMAIRLFEDARFGRFPRKSETDLDRLDVKDAEIERLTAELAAERNLADELRAMEAEALASADRWKAACEKNERAMHMADREEEKRVEAARAEGARQERAAIRKAVAGGANTAGDHDARLALYEVVAMLDARARGPAR